MSINRSRLVTCLIATTPNHFLQQSVRASLNSGSWEICRAWLPTPTILPPFRLMSLLALETFIQSNSNIMGITVSSFFSDVSTNDLWSLKRWSFLMLKSIPNNSYLFKLIAVSELTTWKATQKCIVWIMNRSAKKCASIKLAMRPIIWYGLYIIPLIN
jgi:hypothetical protein